MVKNKACRSSYDGKPWKCRCGFTNKPTKHKLFSLPAFQCESCKRELTLDFFFCLGDIEADGKSLVGKVCNQYRTPYCVAYAYAKAAEIIERILSIEKGMDPDDVRPINPRELQTRFDEKFPEVASGDYRNSNAGLQRVLHMGLILRSEGIQRKGLRERYIAADVSTIPREAFEDICKSIAEGVPLVATYLTGKRKGLLPYCKVYKSAPLDRYEAKKAPLIGHAVVLIGAGMKNGRRFFYFMNSWGERFCPRKNKKGETVKAGVGKLRDKDLTKNVIRLSRPNEAGGERRLQDQAMLNISNLNYILMMAPERQCFPERWQKMREDDQAGEIEADFVDDGIFEDDEGGHLQSNSTTDQGRVGGATRNDWLRPLGNLFPFCPKQRWVVVPPTLVHDSHCSHNPVMRSSEDSKMIGKEVYGYETVAVDDRKELLKGNPTHSAVGLNKEDLLVTEQKDSRRNLLHKGRALLKNWRMRFTGRASVA